MKKLIIILGIFLLSGCFPAPAQNVYKVINPKLDTIVKIDKVDSLAKVATITVKTVDVQRDSIRKLHRQMYKERMEARKKYIWGGVDPFAYFFGELYALIGIFISTWIITRKGIKSATNQSPSKFSWMFWWGNNKPRILRAIGTMLFIFVCMRFSFEIFQVPLTMFLAFLFDLLTSR